MFDGAVSKFQASNPRMWSFRIHPGRPQVALIFAGGSGPLLPCPGIDSHVSLCYRTTPQYVMPNDTCKKKECLTMFKRKRWPKLEETNTSLIWNNQLLNIDYAQVCSQMKGSHNYIQMDLFRIESNVLGRAWLLYVDPNSKRLWVDAHRTSADVRSVLTIGVVTMSQSPHSQVSVVP